MLALGLLLAALWAPAAQARCPRPGESQIDILLPRHTAAPALLTGASTHGDFAAGLSLGFPQQALRAQLGVCDWTVSAEYTTTLGADHWPAVGLSRPWLQVRRFYLGGEALVGAHIQGGLFVERGPMIEGRLRVARLGFRLTPYLSLSTRHVFSLHRVQLDTPSGVESDYSVQHAWRPTGALGVGIGLTDRVGLDLALDLPWPSPPKVAIPGVHLGVVVNGQAPRGPR